MALPLTLLTVTIFLGIAVLPALITFGVVYYKDKKEEKETMRDAEANSMEKKMKLMYAHRKSVKKRYKNYLEHNCPIKEKSINLQAAQVDRVNDKEKRGMFWNSLSHAWFPSLAAAGACLPIIKLGIGAAIILGGPPAWGVAIGLAAVIGIGVGIYFAVKRYDNLKDKKKFEKKTSILDARITEIHGIKNKPKYTVANQFAILRQPSNQINVPQSSQKPDSGLSSDDESEHLNDQIIITDTEYDSPSGSPQSDAPKTSPRLFKSANNIASPPHPPPQQEKSNRIFKAEF